MDKVASALRCTGREERLEDCVLEREGRTPGKATCSKPTSVAGVICETSKQDHLLEPGILFKVMLSESTVISNLVSEQHPYIIVFVPL